MIEVKNLVKRYGDHTAVDHLSFEIEKGKIYGFLGPNGAGKSTFLNCIGGLDTIDSGSVVVDGKEIAGLSQTELSEYRRDNLGYIFQFYNLVPNLTVRENIQVCEYLTKTPLDMDELLETLGLTGHQNKFPSQLSGGQQQRCAIARALIKNPKLLLCDEPTGALDSKSSHQVMELFQKLNDEGVTVVMITHDSHVAQCAKRIVDIFDGEISERDRKEETL